MRTLIPIIACLVLVGGCETRHSLETHLREVADEIADSLLTDWGVEYPCSPCPDTVYKYKVKVIEYRMLAGRWLNPRELLMHWTLKDWPDSVFILSKLKTEPPPN